MSDFGSWHEGDRVRATFNSGTAVEGRLERRQDRLVLPWSDWDWVTVIRPGGMVNPSLSVEKITDPDEGCERITDIDEVRVGDVAVFGSMRGEVIDIDDENPRLEIKNGDAYTTDKMWMYDDAFRYALRKRPALPTEPGFYQDWDGDVWIVGNRKFKDGLYAAPLTDGKNRLYLPGKAPIPLEADEISLYAPFTRVELTPAKEETK